MLLKKEKRLKMEKNRNIVELLKLLKSELSKYKNFQDGLCFLVDEIYSNGILDSDDGIILFHYIDSYRHTFKPTPEDLYELENIFSPISLEKGSWGWYPGRKEPRLKWIDERIKIEGNAQSKLVKP